MKTSIVLGLCYGDESKGVITSFLCGKDDLVVRFSGGQQSGHTVEKNGSRHIFSSFGSGTLNGAHTYISEYCTISPRAFYNEQQALIKNGISPVHYIHPLTMVTTPFDINHNRSTEDVNQHGSVGVGFGATVARTQSSPHKLFVQDLLYRPCLINKLHNIAQYYKAKNADKEIAEFLEQVGNINLNVCTLEKIKDDYNHIIFEGSQGIMLDMDHGYFPNVTRSNTTSKNSMQIIRDNNLPVPDIYYLMRSYLTRHGNGYMPNESDAVCYPDATNKDHPYQGKFRQGYHSLEELRYAVQCDSIYSGHSKNRKHLSISCMDQTNNQVLVDEKHIDLFDFLEQLAIPFNSLLTNYSPSPDTVLSRTHSEIINLV